MVFANALIYFKCYRCAPIRIFTYPTRLRGSARFSTVYSGEDSFFNTIQLLNCLRTHAYLLCKTYRQGRIQELGKRGSDKYIHNWGRGRAPSRDSKRVWGSADSSPSGVWGEAPAAFLLLRLFSMKFTVIFNTFPSRDIRITRACMDSDDILHNAMVPTGSAIKFVTQSFCEFVTEACTWPCTSTCRSINDSCMF